MSKEEQRNYKLYAQKFRDRDDRKDVRLFEYIRKSGPKFNERKIIRELYGQEGKNSYYRLKNRLLTEIGKGMVLHHNTGIEELEAYHYFSLAILYREKQAPEIAEFFLEKAEKKAKSMGNLGLLDLIYGEYISLSFSLSTINPETFIEQREENRKELNRFREIDNILAAVSYRIRFAQNFSQQDHNIIDLLRKTVDEFSGDPNLQVNPKFRFRMYEGVSKILLQNKDYEELERYLKQTYTEFIQDDLFDRHNHDTRLQILTYLINACFKNKNYNDSLKYVELLKEGMGMFNNLLYDKYLIFYYNSLANNYIELDPDKGKEILEEMLKVKEIVRIPLYRSFVTVNLAVFSYVNGELESAVKQVSKLRILDSYQSISASMRMKIEIFELMVRFDLKDFDTIEYRLNQMRQDFGELLQDKAFYGDNELLNLISEMIRVPDPRQKPALKERILHFMQDYAPQDTDFIEYREWLKAKVTP
ncbi:MAG: hypothetical protein H6581_11445 [Bacteroidia bacterium]|nr:hypothetical protein [Bacteroidia bacterium]